MSGQNLPSAGSISFEGLENHQYTDHFASVGKMIEVGKGGQLEV